MNEPSLQHGSPRLFIKDKNSGIVFLIDCGSDVSVLPMKLVSTPYTIFEFSLFAANDTVINTYGLSELNLNLGLPKTYLWNFVIADVPIPIIGADFHENEPFNP